MTVYPKKNVVLFAKAFSYEGAENISHITLDGERTPCGRTGWATEEGWDGHEPDCRRCFAAWKRLSDEEKA